MKTPKTDHNLLIEKCKQGDDRALMEIYNRYYKAMYNTSIRIVKNNYEAEDIMQEAFITAFKKLDKLENTENFGAWLKRIVVNKSIEIYKKNISKNESEIDDKLYKLESIDSCNDKALETKTKYENVLNAMSEASSSNK